MERLRQLKSVKVIPVVVGYIPKKLELYVGREELRFRWVCFRSAPDLRSYFKLRSLVKWWRWPGQSSPGMRHLGVRFAVTAGARPRARHVTAQATAVSRSVMVARMAGLIGTQVYCTKLLRVCGRYRFYFED